MIPKPYVLTETAMKCAECDGDKWSPYPGLNKDGSPDYGPCQRCEGSGVEPDSRNIMPKGEITCSPISQ
jgi:DnaJ-class molecular chaperone